MTIEVKIKEPSVKLVAYTVLNPELFPEINADFMPVVAARVSHGQDENAGQDLDKDIKLMNYLAEHKHMSPFEHTSVTFLVEAPIFVAREWMRHRTQSYNEVSARYTSNFLGDVWFPREFREQATRNKQSSAGAIASPLQDVAKGVLDRLYNAAMKAYVELLDLGVAREIARAVMPVGHMTRFYATANLRNWHHFCELRLSDDAQQEIRELARLVDAHLTKLYPQSWMALQRSQ